MAYRTANGKHYHQNPGCSAISGREIMACGTDQLEPCSLCAKASSSTGGLVAGGGDPSDGPAPFTQGFKTVDDEESYAIRITTSKDGQTSEVSSKGSSIAMVRHGAGSSIDRDALERILAINANPELAREMQHAPLPEVSSKDVRSLYFDMDGTIADLYAVPNWLPKLRAYDSSPYEDAVPLVDMAELNEYIMRLKQNGWHVGVVSWLSKVPTPEYDRAVSASKYLWLMRNLPTLDEINFVSYGVAKQDAVASSENAVLVDDEEQNLRAWTSREHGRTSINAKDPRRMMAALRNLAMAG